MEKSGRNSSPDPGSSGTGRFWLGAALFLALNPAPPLGATSPTLSEILPRGVQRGTEATLILNGARLADAADLLACEPGITLVKIEAASDSQAKAAVKVAPDARIGEHSLRLRTKTGISELRTLWIGALPAIDEAEPNGDFQKPQKVPLNVTVAGRIESEDVDFFAFEAKKGQRVTAEVEGMRLGGALFDPGLSILNSARFALASSDDSPLLGQDPAASLIVPEDGTYIVEVHESAYGGCPNCYYRLHLGTFPRPLAVYPAGGKLGDEVEVTFLGDPSGEVRQKVKLPAAPEAGFGLFAQDGGGIAPSPNPFRLSELGNVLEAEPNDSQDKATPAGEGLAINGVISHPGDVDFFRFPAKKGQALEVSVHARRLRSALDSVLTVWNLGGGPIASNDDSGGPDSSLRFTVPEDKEYAVSVTDHLGKGGPCFVYRIEIVQVQPRLTLNIPLAAPYSQERQAIPVPRGNRMAFLAAAGRADFGGEVVVGAEGLPQGVSFQAESIAANADATPAVLEAAPDAPLSGVLAVLTGRAADPALKIQATFRGSADLIVGPPGQSVFWRREWDRLAVCVTEEAPFKLDLVEPKGPLVQNGAKEIKVTAERKAGFNAPIALQMVFNPPGVSSAGGISIAEGKNEASIPLNAAREASIRPWKIAVLGSAAVGGGPVWVSTPLVSLRIAPRPFTLKLDRGAVEQGKETEILCRVEAPAPFEGTAKVRLLGLPPKVAVQEAEVTKGTKEFAFKVSAEAQSPAGQHKNLFCQVIFVQDGEPIAYGSGSSELRIDPPPPPKAAKPQEPAPPPAEKKAEPPKPEAKRLTRLEKLRVEAEERAKAAKKEEAK